MQTAEVMDIAAETVKTVFREVWLLVSNAVRLVFLILHQFLAPRMPPAAESSSSSAEATTPTAAAEVDWIAKDDVQEHEKRATGFFEDIHMNALNCIDRVVHISLPMFLTFHFADGMRELMRGLSKLNPFLPISPESIDDRTVEKIILSEGYPYESWEVPTKDGYLLLLERLPRKSSRSVIYLQHGVIDTCYAFVGRGVTGSLAFRLWDAGYDVFLGNLRGTGRRGHVRADITPQEYWNFSIDDHAFYDVEAILKRISLLKKNELASVRMCSADDDGKARSGQSPLWKEEYEKLGTPENNHPLEADRRRLFRVYGVAHSMGAASLLMHVIHTRMEGKRHRLDMLILLSPAGYHLEYPLIFRILGPVMDVVAAPFFNSWRFPSEFWRILASKLVADFRHSRDTRRVLAALASRLVTGGSGANNPIVAIHNTVYHTLSGTSMKVYHQFRQWAKSSDFRSFNHGDGREVVHFFDHYDLIDIPVHICAGADDTLIPAANCRRHFEEIEKAHRGLATFTLFEDCAHVDFTLGLNDEVISYIMSVLPVASFVPLVSSSTSSAVAERLLTPHR